MAELKVDEYIKDRVKDFMVPYEELTDVQLRALSTYEEYKLGELVSIGQRMLAEEKYIEENKEQVDELIKKEEEEKAEEARKKELAIQEIAKKKSDYVKAIAEWYSDNADRIDMLIEKYLSDVMRGGKYIPALTYDQNGTIMLQIKYEIPRGDGKLKKYELFVQNIMFYPLTENEDNDIALEKIFSEFDSELIRLLEDAEKLLRRKA